MNNTLKLILAVVAAGFLFAGCDKKEATTQTTQSQNGPSDAAKAANHYENAGISFQYPISWHSARSEAVTAMKTQLTNELRNFNRALVAFDMLISSDEEVALLVSKVQTDNALTAADILSERGKVYDDATRAGDVTKINKLETTTVKNLPVIVEDVERSNGGRGHTVKLFKGRFIVELSLIVNNKAQYENHIGEYEEILASLTVQEEKGEIKTSSSDSISIKSAKTISDDEFATITARLMLLSNCHGMGCGNRAGVAVQLSLFEVPAGEEANQILKQAGISSKEYEIEYAHRMWHADSEGRTTKLNDVLFDKLVKALASYAKK